MANVVSENNTGGDKTAAAIEHHKQQIELLEEGLERAEMKRDRAVERAEASIAHLTAKLEKQEAALAALENED